MNSVFLKIDGVSGESKDAMHQGWIDADTWSWGTQHNDTQAGPGKSHFSNLVVHCRVDKATAGLLLYSANGTKRRKVEISACKAGDGQQEYYRITLENVMITDVGLRDNGMQADVTYEFQGDRVKFQYWEQADAGGKAAETRMGWDIKNSSSCF
ncbi:type VI secretion system tube protein Hcp [Paramixta manurensis]|uniref:Type VI secretion system tube protein Hcp n=1 Tax=Paramixta manurensis TaxID=2740817 RepID=A0A6M8UL94_9GAMM|nr:type VI secretion system tube protein Hcp [Erwiniaceae bacterium PD-1]